MDCLVLESNLSFGGVPTSPYIDWEEELQAGMERFEEITCRRIITEYNKIA
jgi:hypothetical protein